MQSIVNDLVNVVFSFFPKIRIFLSPIPNDKNNVCMCTHIYKYIITYIYFLKIIQVISY